MYFEKKPKNWFQLGTEIHRLMNLIIKLTFFVIILKKDETNTPY